MVRRPGIEPRSKHWQRSIITFKTNFTLVYGTLTIAALVGSLYQPLWKFHESFNKSICGYAIGLQHAIDWLNFFYMEASTRKDSISKATHEKLQPDCRSICPTRSTDALTGNDTGSSSSNYDDQMLFQPQIISQPHACSVPQNQDMLCLDLLCPLVPIVPFTC